MSSTPHIFVKKDDWDKILKEEGTKHLNDLLEIEDIINFCSYENVFGIQCYHLDPSYSQQTFDLINLLKKHNAEYSIVD